MNESEAKAFVGGSLDRVDPGVLVDASIRRVVVCDDARSTSKAGGFAWLIEALAAAVMSLVPRGSSSKWEVLVATKPTSPEEEEILSSLVLAAQRAGNTVEYLDGGGGRPVTRTQWPYRAPNFGSLPPGCASASAVQELADQLEDYLAWNYRRPLPIETKQVDGSFKEIIAWHWHLARRRREARLGSEVVAIAPPGRCSLKGYSGNWTSAADVDSARKLHKRRSQIFGRLRSWLQTKLGAKSIPSAPAYATLDRRELVEWAVGKTYFELPNPWPGTASGSKTRLWGVLDGIASQPMFHMPAVWTTNAIQSEHGGLLFHEAASPFWVELVFPFKQDPRPDLSHAILHAVLGRHFAATASNIGFFFDQAIPGCPLVRQEIRAAVYVDAPTDLRTAALASRFLEVAALFDIGHWLAPFESVLLSDEEEVRVGFSVQERSKRVRRAPAKPRRRSGSRTGGCAERTENRAALMEKAIRSGLVDPKVRRLSPSPRPSGPAISLYDLLHACCFLLVPDTSLSTVSRDPSEDSEEQGPDAGDVRGRRADLLEWIRAQGERADPEDYHEKGTDYLGWWTWFHGTRDYGVSLNGDLIASVAVQSYAGSRTVGAYYPTAGPPRPLDAVQRFAALLLKVALHEAHHFVEELAITQLEVALRPVGRQLFLQSGRAYSGPNSMCEALANADALDRARWIVGQGGGRRLASFASDLLSSDRTTTVAVAAYLEGIASRQSGWYGVANRYRRTEPLLSPPPPLRSHPGPGGTTRSGDPNPADGSDYWLGVSQWIHYEVLPTTPGTAAAMTSTDLSALSSAFECARAAYEICDHEFKMAVKQSAGDPFDLVGSFKYFATQNRLLREW